MKQISLILIVVALFLLTSKEANAQVQNITLPIPPTTKLGWTHTGVNVAGFRLVVDGVQTDLGNVPRVPITTANPTLYSVPFPALTPGNHIIVVLAYNTAGNSLNSNELQVVVSVGVPDAATGLVLIQSK